MATALSKAQGMFDHATKDVKNDFFKSKYADLAGCIDAAKKHLSDNGLAVIQTTEVIDNCLYLRTTLMHLSGEYMSGLYPIDPLKRDPQGFGSAMTYARRYTFCAITGIASDDDDDDGNSASENNKKNEVNQSYYDDREFDRNLPTWRDIVAAGSKTPAQIIAIIETKAKLTRSQLNTLEALKKKPEPDNLGDK